MGQRSLFKWQKVCGILSEAMSNVETGQISNVIIGMGINFSITETEFPEDIRQKLLFSQMVNRQRREMN